MRPCHNLSLALLGSALVSLVPILPIHSNDPAVPKEDADFSVVVRTETPTPTIHHDLDRGKLRKLAGANQAGLTRLLLTMTTQLETTFVSSSDGDKSFWVSGISVNLRYPAIDIYVISDYPSGSCKYQAVLEHEQQHVELDRTLVQEYAERIESALRAAPFPKYASPRWVGSASDGLEQTEVQVRKILDPLFEELEERRSEANRSFDSPETYDKLVARCSRE